MSQQQQYRMAAEVAKALDVVADTHRDLAQLVRRLFVHWNLSDEEQLALLGRLPGAIAAGLSDGDVHALSADCEIAERIGHLLSIHRNRPTKAVIDGGFVQMSTRGRSKPSATRQV